jgi:lysophospholipase L1-like esterase
MRLERLALLPVLVLVYVLVAEAGLQIAAFFMQRATRAEMPVAWVTGNLRVLCLGDSNTYGVWLDDRSQAYPQQLEAIWNERIETPKLEVLNLGVPGTNSSRLVRELPQMFATFAPDILIVMVGVNDFWTQPVATEDAPKTQPLSSFWKRYSLLYRIYFLFQRGRIASEPEFLRDPDSSLEGTGRHKVRFGDQEFDMGFTAARSTVPGDGIGLRANLRRLAELAREAGTSLFLMNYPSQVKYYVFANKIIAETAEETGTPLIDLTGEFATICPQNQCPEELFPDGHPNASGYRRAAETIVERLARRGSS